LDVKTQKVYKILITDLDELKTATKNAGVSRAGSRRHSSSHSSVASLIAPDQWCVFCTPSLAVFPTRCNQLDSKSGEFGGHR